MAVVTLSVPLSDIWIDIRFTLPSCTVDGGMPVVTVEDAVDRDALGAGHRAPASTGPSALPAGATTSTSQGAPSTGIPSRSPTTPA